MANQLYKGDKPLATFVPQIADNLTTDDSTKALSAKQGKVLNEKIEIMLGTTKIFDELGIATSATSYNCNWQNYNFLLICTQRYSNITTSMLIPKTYFANSSAGERPLLTDTQYNISYSIYKNGNGSIYASASASRDDCGIRIYGLM